MNGKGFQYIILWHQDGQLLSQNYIISIVQLNQNQTWDLPIESYWHITLSLFKHPCTFRSKMFPFMISCPSSRSTAATTHKMFKRMELWMVVLKLLKKRKQWNRSTWDPQFLFSEKITRKSKSLRIILPPSYRNFLPKSSLFGLPSATWIACLILLPTEWCATNNCRVCFFGRCAI